LSGVTAVVNVDAASVRPCAHVMGTLQTLISYIK
jgi:hypothetical protein